MAWNEPGNNGDKDPWGGKRGDEQGPPDLDEAIRKLQGKLGALFGGGSGSKSTGNGGGGGSAVGIILVVLLGLWAAYGFYIIDQQERGVVLRLGKYLETTPPGLHWNPPLIDKVAKINVTKVRSNRTRGTMLTEDENIVDVTLSVQYVVIDPKDFYLNVRDPELSLDHATESALRHVVGGTEMHGILTEGREVLAVDVQARLQQYLDIYQTGLNISKVNIENSQPPREVQAAFDDVIKAKEDEERVKNEAEAYANGIIPVARGYAQRAREEANGYREQVIAKAKGEADRFVKLLKEYEKAPEVTRERLYIDAIESVLASSSKVMVDVEGGNNLLYLPLDKLGQSQGGRAISRTRTGSSQLNSAQMDELTNQIIEKLKERQSTTTRRSGGR